jgi:anion-transporting  ArsA/GET3 family ATPase
MVVEGRGERAESVHASRNSVFCFEGDGKMSNLGYDNGEAITDYELYEQKRHDESTVKHGEYDESTEDMMEKIEKLEKQVAELAKQIEELKSWL